MSDIQDEIRAAREVIAGASPGPWRHDGNSILAADWSQVVCVDYYQPKEEVTLYVYKGDGAFILAARMGWPKAIDALEVSLKREERLKDLLRRALDQALPDGLGDPKGCWAEGEAIGRLFDEARRILS